MKMRLINFLYINELKTFLQYQDRDQTLNPKETLIRSAFFFFFIFFIVKKKKLISIFDNCDKLGLRISEYFRRIHTFNLARRGNKTAFHSGR